MLTRCLIPTLAVAFILACWPVGAADIVLTIDGKTQGESIFEFSLSDLEAMPSASVTTDTPWHDNAVTFTGVRLADLMTVVGADGATAYVVALNDYAVEVPIADFEAFGVILALKADGAYMPVDDKGPLFVIYPFDANPKLNSEEYFMRAVWQVKSITVE